MKAQTRRRILAGTFGVVLLIGSLATAQAVSAATANADISIRLVAKHRVVGAGQEVTYVARMTNHGPDDAIFVDAIFSWPAQLQPISMTCDEGISADGPGCEYSSLKAGQTVVSTLVGIPLPSAGKFTVRARASFEIDCSFDPNCTFDPHLKNNSAWVTTRLIGHKG